jgi:Holliday junction DNA helicase RuvA
MIYSLKGIVQELTPTFAVIDVSGVGYYVGISLQTSQNLTQGSEVLLYIQQIIREDAHLLFGFFTKQEKEMFNLLISVNGVGPVSALILLSSLSLSEAANAILSGNSGLIQKVKGIVLKQQKELSLIYAIKLVVSAIRKRNFLILQTIKTKMKRYLH